MSRHPPGIRNFTAIFLIFAVAPPSNWAQEAPSSARQEAHPSLTTIGQRITSHLSQGWQDFDITPSPRATDEEWCRRTYLNLIGRIPTTGELAEYLDDRASYKRRRLVHRLLYDSRYSGALARNWATIWTNLLIGRTGGTTRDSLIDRDGLYQYLVNCFLENKPYDQMVTELITATGTTRPGSPEFNGATNFLVMKLADQAVQATTATAQVFLGTQVQCTQCHHHPFHDARQDQFWQLNAFYRQTVALRRFDSDGGLREVELADQDFAGEGNHPEEAEVYFEERNGVLRVAYPVFLDGTPLVNRSGYLADVNRRKELASFVCQSPLLEEALVNRLWKHFFAYGFTDPVDDLGPHRAVSHPELFQELARQFRGHHFDLRQLMTWLALSEPHALSSRIQRGNAADQPENGQPPRFSRYYARPMTPEQLYESLLVVAGTSGFSGPPATLDDERADWLQQFITAIDNDEAEESSTFNGTIPQTLMMFNGQLTERAIDLEGDNLLTRVIASRGRPAAKADRLFQAALARRPSARERNLANRLLSAKMRSAGSSPDGTGPPQPPAAEALQDLYWALLNCNEFILNH